MGLHHDDIHSDRNLILHAVVNGGGNIPNHKCGDRKILRPDGATSRRVLLLHRVLLRGECK